MKRTNGQKVFSVFNALLLFALTLIFLIPVWHVFCASISEPTLLNAHRGTLIAPLGQLTLGGYEQVFGTKYIVSGYINTLIYVVAATAIGMLLTCFGAYGLSRHDLLLKKPLTFLIAFTMLFNGGLIPTYLMVKTLGLLDSVWAIILPNCVSVFNLMIMRTSFASVPDSLIDAARIDGAGHMRMLCSVILPVSKSILAVVILFYVVQQWNSWFHTAIYVHKRDLYPLQIWLREIIIAESTNSLESEGGDYNAFNQTRVLVKYAVIMISIIPMIVIYPFVQRYFVTGVMIGSIKE